MSGNQMFFSRLRRLARKWSFSISVIVLVASFAAVAVANATVLGSHKQKINRDDVYYEIVNDNDDHGNYIETYHVPNGRGGKVYCIVYSDQMKGGGGAGIDCDWGHPS